MNDNLPDEEDSDEEDSDEFDNFTCEICGEDLDQCWCHDAVFGNTEGSCD